MYKSVYVLFDFNNLLILAYNVLIIFIYKIVRCKNVSIICNMLHK